ncbi:MAG TPA: glycosyltransferase family 1 protein [Rhodospirillales bacterium]|nr:glycosyltransferase family 1 protein [Rhodospirillales bacterium]
MIATPRHNGTTDPRPGAPGRRVRVLVNGVHAHSGGGVTYLRNMLPMLAADPELELHLIVHEEQLALLGPLDARLHVHALGFRNGFFCRLLWEQAALPFLVRRLGADVTFSPANFGPLLAPAPVVLLRNTLAVAETETRFSKRLYWRGLGAMTALSLLGCRRAIAVSEYAARVLTRRLPAFVERRVAVVHHGIGPPFAPPPEGAEREDFVLAVADLYVQKNLHGLLDALDTLKDRFPDIRLKVAGRAVDHDYEARLKDIIAVRALRPHVEMLGDVAPERLAELYRACALFVFPSFVETFGMPLVEAMASGAPIVSSNAAAMPEVLGEAALFFQPGDTAAMAARLAEALGDGALRRRLGALALARAGQFSWQEAARRTAAVLKAAPRRNSLSA